MPTPTARHWDGALRRSAEYAGVVASRIRKPLLLSIGAAAGLAGAVWTRHALGLEFDPRSLRDFVASLGPAAPLALVLLITFRSLLGIPSQLALIAAGLCFGTLAGALYGSLGLTASGLGTFLLARYAGREALESRAPPRLKRLLERSGNRLGAVLVAVGTGYPIGFITGYHALAGVTRMRLATFGVALVVGSGVRAATYTFFGSSLVAGGLAPVLQATALIAAVLALPLFSPRARAWLKRGGLAELRRGG